MKRIICCYCSSERQWPFLFFMIHLKVQGCQYNILKNGSYKKNKGGGVARRKSANYAKWCFPSSGLLFSLLLVKNLIASNSIPCYRKKLSLGTLNQITSYIQWFCPMALLNKYVCSCYLMCRWEISQYNSVHDQALEDGALYLCFIFPDK